jgi:zinc protease
VTDPGLRPEALAQIQASLLPQLEQINAVPGNLFQVRLASYLHSGDPRWAFPTAADIQGATPEALQALLRPELASGPIEITVVGDTTIDAAIAAVARTFGAIPGHDTATRMKASKFETTFPAHTKTPVILEHQGGADQGLAAVAWPTTDAFADIKSDAARQLLADVLQQRLFETLRLQDGKSYSTPAQSQYSTVFPGYGAIIAYADIPPAKSQLFFDAEHRISADLRAHPVSADELERVRAPAVANSAKSRQTNDYWAYWLSAIQSEPRVEGLIAQNLDNLRNVTAADLQKAANTWLRDDTRWEMVVQPAAKPAAAPTAGPVTK